MAHMFCFSKGERLIHLTVIAVRKRYRKFGVGKFLISVSISWYMYKWILFMNKTNNQLDVGKCIEILIALIFCNVHVWK